MANTNKVQPLQQGEIRRAIISFPWEGRPHKVMPKYGLNPKGELTLVGGWDVSDMFSQSVLQVATEKPQFDEVSLQLVKKADAEGRYDVIRKAM